MAIYSNKILACLLAVAGVFLHIDKYAFCEGKYDFLGSVALYEKVFATEGKGKGLEPMEVKSLLEDLKTSYYGMNDDGSRSVRNTISSLIDACDTSNSSKCYQGTFLKLNSLLRDNLQFSVNVIPYLQYCKNEMFVKCKQYFDGELRENVKHLDDVDRDKIKSLVDMVSKVSKENSLKLTAFTNKISRKVLMEAVKNLIESNKNLVDVNQSAGLNENEKYKKVMDSVCNVAVDQISRSTQHYEQHFMNDRQLKDKLEPFELEWVLNVKICRFIQHELNVVRSYD